MGHLILGDILTDWSAYELDDSIYISADRELSVDLEVTVLPFDPTRKRVHEGQTYLLGIEQIREIVNGLDQQLERRSLLLERLKAVSYFAKHDAFIPVSAL